MPPLPDDRVRALAAEILARDEYARWRPATAQWWLDLLRQLERWLAGFSDWMRALSATQPVVYWLVVAGLVLLPALLLAHGVWTWRVALASLRPPAVPARQEGDAPRFLEEAEELARDGSFLDAAHRVQLAAVDILLRRRVLELSRSDPNRVLRQRLTDSPLCSDDRRDFLTLLDRFETHWFRDGYGDRDLYEAWRALHARLGALPTVE